MKTRPVLLFLSAFVLLTAGCLAQEPPAASVTPDLATPSLSPLATAPAPSPSVQAFPMSGPQAGSEMSWIDGSTLVYVPAGEFVMGDGAADAPLHLVRLSAYWIQQSEVTNAMYAACVRAGVCRGLPSLTEAGGEERPVTGVTWIQARNYCDWIQGRLPTEAEWERAAQGPGSAIYPWGADAPDCEHANFGGCRRVLNAVGSLRRGNSPFGLFDMAGNAAEWVGDWYAPDYYQNSPSDDPVGPPAGDMRVVRGGSYASSAAQVSVYSRAYEWPRRSRADLGFRCVVPAPILYPPLCQTLAVIPEADDAGSCQPPVTKVRGSYCQQKKGYVSLDIPAGSRWRVETPRFTCSAVPVASSVERLVCYGQGNLDFQVTVCSAECFGSRAGLSPVCPTGYVLDAASGRCVYTLASADTCPQGFVSLKLDGDGICIPGAVGQICPVGQYWDAGAGGCLPPGSQEACLIYGRLSADAEKCYQGCPPGSAYDADSQCCQNRGTVFNCPAGYVYDQALRACISGAGFSSQGCITVTLRTGACVDCGVYPNCVPGCQPDKKTQTCIMK